MPTFLFPSIADADIQGRLRTDIDATLEKLCPGDSNATPLYNNLDSISENFPLVASTVTESLHLCTLPASLRIVSADIEFQANNGSAFVVRRGEMMMGDLREGTNELLTTLRIPIPIHAVATGLTPSLLVAMLECFLSSWLPLSPSIRQAAVSKIPAPRAEALNARMQCMKIFLGVGD